MRKQRRIIKGITLLALLICGAAVVVAFNGCGGGGDDGNVTSVAADACPGQKACGTGCIPTNASCCSDGSHCPSPFTCNANGECECPAGQMVCSNSCIPANASCCPNGTSCPSPALCGPDNQCSSDSVTSVVSQTYHMSAQGCAGGIIYGYTGHHYTVCNAYINAAIASACTKIVNNCGR